MRVFMTGASGWIGAAVAPELLEAGHEVVGLARSAASADALTAAGVQVRRGDLEDLDSVRAGAGDSDGVIHLGFVHDFAHFEQSVRTDLLAIQAMGEALAGSQRPLVIASGTPPVVPGHVATERDMPDPLQPRAEAAATTVALADRGVRSSVLRLPPSVHGHGEKGFVPMLIDIARNKGVSGYIDDGANQWSAVHRLDAATLFRLALEGAPAGSVLHGVGDEALPTRVIAETIGRHLDLPVISIPREEAAAHFGWMAIVFAHNRPASGSYTNELLGWRPSHSGLVEDMEAGNYFSEAPTHSGSVQ